MLLPRLPALLFFCALTPLPALANTACPTRSDLATGGITLSSTSVPVTRHIERTQGTYRATLTATQSGHAIEAIDRGTHALAVAHSDMHVDGVLEAHRSQSTTFHDDLSGLDRLETTTRVESRFTLTSDSHPDRDGVMRWERIGSRKIDVADCSYWAQIIDVTTELEDKTLNLAQAIYLPELSAVIFSTLTDAAGETKPVVAFDTVRAGGPE